jgi:hypothetical protein
MKICRNHCICLVGTLVELCSTNYVTLSSGFTHGSMPSVFVAEIK